MKEEVTMEIFHPSKHEFMSQLPRFEPVNRDHTADIAAKQCLRKYFYQIVLARQPKDDAVYFAWGTAYHRFRQVLENEYKKRSNGYGFKFNEAEALAAFGIGLMTGVRYWTERGKEQGIESKFSWMTEKRFIASCKIAFEHWKIEKKQGKIEVLAIEQPFNVSMPDGSNRGGTADQIVRWQGKVWGRDFKTTSKDSSFYERTLDPNDQFTGYTYCEGLLKGERIEGQLVELLYNGKSTKKEQKGPEIITLVASRTEYQLKDWAKGHKFWMKVLELAREEDNYPMSEVGCSFCQFHEVCTAPNEAKAINLLENKYNLRPWDHTKVGAE
jgi:PD-(D/E)XK nuclease superfamily